MKIKACLFFLLALFVLFASSCVVVDPAKSEQTSATADTSAATFPIETEPQTEPVTTPQLPQKPLWGEGDAQREAQAVLYAPKSGIVDVSEQSYTYSEMQEDLSLLARVYPSLFSYRSIGKSVAGRDIYVAVLGNPNAQKQVVVSAAIHAREYMTAMLTMKQLEFYLSHYSAGTYNGVPYAVLFENVCFYIVPMTNPDGVMLAQEGLSSLPADLREVVQSIYANENGGYESIDLYLSHWKANARGVDLNRNYDALWEEYDKASRPQSAQYKGPSPASEPETQAMIGLIESLSNPVCTLCIHSQGEVLYWNCGQSDTERTLRFTQEIAERTGYYIVPTKNNDASLSDWCELKKNMISVTVETGNEPCPLPIGQFTAIWLANYDLLPLTARYFM